MAYDTKKTSSGFWPSDQCMKLLLKEISSHSLLTKEEEQCLFKIYEKTDEKEKQKIRARIVNANMRFVLKVALSYRNIPGADVLEIVSEGKIGLLNAIELFKWETNNKFISFAVWHIRAKVSKYLESTDLIRIPAQKKLRLNKMKKERLLDEFDDDTYNLYQITSQMTSLETPVGDHEFTISDVLADEAIGDFDEGMVKIQISNILEEIFGDVLNNEEITVLQCLYGIGRDEIGLKETKDIVGKSHERVRQIRDRAFQKLRRNNLMQELRTLIYEAGSK
jgi:RNA polymerase primary sigma factor